MLKSDVLSQLKQLKKDIREASNERDGTIKGSLGRFGFLVLDDGRECFLNPEEMQKVFPGDRVIAEISKDEKGRDVATIVKLRESRLTYFAGRYINRGKGHFAEPDLTGLSRWIFIPPKKRKQAKPGDYILCRILQHPFKEGKPQAEVVKVIGNLEQPGVPFDYVLAKYNLGGKNPGSVNGDQIRAHIKQQTTIRKDLRDTNFVTIDAATTLDMDDALHAQRTENGWNLTVAIADPAEFVTQDSDADKYARRLGSSSYFPNRVISMLHPQLANEYCSLQPGQDRLALLCSLSIDDTGTVTASTIEEGVIQSKAKLSYLEVSEILENREEQAEKPKDEQSTPVRDEALSNILKDQLKCLQDIAQALHKKRRQEALITANKPEFNLLLDKNRKVEKIVPRQMTIAHQLIEEIMIAANRAAAAYLKKHAKEALYTAHSGFRPERIEQLKAVIGEQCTGFDTCQLEDWQGLKHLVGHLETNPAELPVEAIASRMLTRGMLSKVPAPHAGMGFAEYTTFTSPIRKYSDLLVHRMIKAILHQKTAKHLSRQALERLQESLRNSRNAVNECEHWLKCEYAQTLKGQAFSGRIQHINGSGFQVRLDDNGLSGTVELGPVTEKFKFDGTRFQHIGENRRFVLEQPVTVKIADVNMDKKLITMVLDDEGA